MTQPQSDDFDIGKAIFEQLKGLPPERQQRIMRWVAEALGFPTGAFNTQATPVESQRPIEQKSTSSIRESFVDIKSFVTSKAPKSDNQFAVVVAYYYRFEASPNNRRDSITGVILQEAARLAGRKRLSNPSKTLNNAKATGYLDSATAGEFSINSVGENLVAMTLPEAGNVTS